MESNITPGQLHLYHIPESPFAIKLLFAIKELGLGDALTVHAIPDPPPADLVEEHGLYPLSAFVPSLVTPSGTIFDSSVILQCLDTLPRPEGAAMGKLFPDAAQDSGLRWAALTYEALCKAVMGTVMMVHQQGQRGAPEKALAPQEERVKRGVARLAQQELPDTGRKVLDVKGIALGSMLGYMEQCEWCTGWREWKGGDILGSWFEQIKHRLP
ncbi:hypothetical protein DACRYDRAFT_20841 [Dacryopinax primogenitus]|uniref:GST N-terminal domain-containing protein n=1 Tax=Dacryopinax primogenitus (strain DJM 731) TaxID=1858805 RepID=M5G239_DACPD|nr:uncharacterized protein DACRYDRAFT_20841 [Dacryopinax primogenitus]EJU04256.1 hypothetical protein DACRYDRAFT_20841 [Dacryopinax primogenitus]